MKWIICLLFIIVFVGCEPDILEIIEQPVVDTSITAVMVGLKPTNNQQEQWIIRNTTMQWIDSVGVFIEPSQKDVYWIRPHKEWHGTLGPTWSYSIYLPIGYKVTPYWGQISVIPEWRTP